MPETAWFPPPLLHADWLEVARGRAQNEHIRISHPNFRLAGTQKPSFRHDCHTKNQHGYSLIL